MPAIQGHTPSMVIFDEFNSIHDDYADAMTLAMGVPQNMLVTDDAPITTDLAIERAIQRITTFNHGHVHMISTPTGVTSDIANMRTEPLTYTDLRNGHWALMGLDINKLSKEERIIFESERDK